MSSLLPYVITGLVAGSLYGLAGVGLVLTYRTSGVLNLGHGAIAAGAAFLFFTLHDQHHVAWPLAAVITVVAFGGIVGWALETITRGLGDVPEAVVVVATVGVLLLVEGFLYLKYGDVARGFPTFLPTSGFELDGVNVSWGELISVLVSGGSSLGLYFFMERVRLGVAMRAVVDDVTLVSLSGDEPRRVRLSAWAIGSAFAAVSGILLAPTLNLDPNLLTYLVVQAFGACAIGLFRSLPMTYIGGLVVGVLASLATKFFVHPPLNEIPTAVPYLVLLVVMLAVPARRFPASKIRQRSLISNVRPMSKRSAGCLAVVGAVALVLIPEEVGPHLPVWTAALVDVVVFASLALLVWTSGQISLGHMAFVAVGVTAMGHLLAAGVPWGISLFVAGLIAIPVGALVAIPAIRLSGLYLALATLGFGILMQDIVYPTSWMFGSGLTVTAGRPRIGPFDGASDRQYYFLVLAIVALCVAVIVLLARSQLGRLLRALSEAPMALATNGLRVNATRVVVFCISAFFAAVAGGLALTQFGAASGVGYGPDQSLILLAVLAVCGTRLLRSSVLAAGLLSVLPGYATDLSVDRQTFVFGLVAVGACMIIAKRAPINAWWDRLSRNAHPELAGPARSLFSSTVRPQLRGRLGAREGTAR